MRIVQRMKSSDVSLTIDYENTNKQRTFHGNIKFIVIFAQIFGLMPLVGVTSKNIQTVRFEWRSLRFVYAAFNCLGALITVGFCVAKFSIYGLEISKTATIMFYISTFLGDLQFIKIARNWSAILREWAMVEMSLKSYGTIPNLNKKIVFVCIAIMGLALIEHILFILNSLHDSYICNNVTSSTGAMYFTAAFPHYFALIEYSPYAAIFVETGNILCTFSWNFTDLFIILICIAISAKFRLISMKIKNKRQPNSKFWKEIREDYNRVYGLTKLIDSHISPLVLICYVGNIYFICIQLYNSLKERVGLIETLYFFYSFGFLFARTIGVSMYGAWLNDETRKPLEVLYSLPSEQYSIDVSRLIEQINATPIGITGSNFFIVTRKFLLRMAGTIITFELMIFQFAPVDRHEQRTVYCT